MFCSNCGHEIVADAVFCAKCGTRVRRADAAEAKRESRVAALDADATRRVDVAETNEDADDLRDGGTPAYTPKRAEIYARSNFGNAAEGARAERNAGVAPKLAASKQASRAAFADREVERSARMGAAWGAAPQVALAGAGAGAGAVSGSRADAAFGHDAAVSAGKAAAQVKEASSALSMNVSEGVSALSAKAAGTIGAVSTLSVNALASRACATLATVSLFMPWLKVPAIAAANGFGSKLGLSNVAGDSSFNLLTLANMLFRDSAEYGLVFYGIIFAIAALLIGGLVSTIQKGRYQSVLTAGCTLAALGAVAWMFLFAYLNAQMADQSYNLLVDVFEMPAWVYVTAISSVAAIVFGTKKRMQA